MGNIRGNPVDDVFLLAAWELGDAIEDLTHFAYRPGVALGRFSAGRLFITDNQQVFDADTEGLGHLFLTKLIGWLTIPSCGCKARHL